MKRTSKRTKAFLGCGRMKSLLIVVVVMLAVGLSGTANGQSSAGSMLVTTVTLPGFGGSNPAFLTPVLRFQLVGTGPLTPLSSIPAFPASLVNDPSNVEFNSQGELFVANRHGNIGEGVGSIARFTFDAAGNFVANGSITGNSLEAVHGLAFSPTGEPGFSVV
ncbi:MAG: hypothetical protein ACE5JU_20735 [Candidatus Binatia bacterium]